MNQFKFLGAIAAICLSMSALAQDYVVQGVIIPETEAVISAPISARVASLYLKEGNAFRQGDVLLEFDCTLLKAESEEARSLLASARARHDVNRELAQHGAVGSAETKVSRAEVDAANAKVKLLKEREKYCTILAPFSGRVVERLINLYETPPENAPLLRVINTVGLEIEMIAPSRWLRWMEPGSTLSFEIAETGVVHSAIVSRIGAVIDPVSQTVSVFAQFVEPQTSVLAGMSGRGEFEGN